jgi:hypothetical protein
MERGAIELNVTGPGHYDFHEHFLSMAELLAPSRILDTGATAPHYWHNLGLAQWVLALPAFLVLLRLVVQGRRGQTPPPGKYPIYFVLTAFGLILLLLPISVTVWERVPGMQYLQFPWRLLGPANLMLAVCLAGGTTLLPAGRWRSLALAIGLATILVLALPVLYPPPWGSEFGGTTRMDIIEAEKDGSLALGTTSTGDFLPVKAAMVPVSPAPSLVESYAGPGPVDRVNRAVLPEGATAEIVEQGALHDRFVVSTPNMPFVFRLYTFYFPGWRAYVDGEEVEIEVAGPEGFITFWVPMGEHEVLVRFEDTLPRTAGWLFSVSGFLVLAFALTRMPAHASPRLRVQQCASLPWLAVVLLSFMIIKGVIVDRQDGWLRHNSPPGQALAAQNEWHADFGHQIELLGYDLPREQVRPGESFFVVLYWHAMVPLDVNYQSFVHLADSQDLQRAWSQGDHLNPGGLPTTEWPLDKYVWDEFEIAVPPETPPGEYVLNVGIYSMAGSYRLQRYDETGQIVGDSAVIDTIVVR